MRCQRGTPGSLPSTATPSLNRMYYGCLATGRAEALPRRWSGHSVAVIGLRCHFDDTDLMADELGVLVDDYGADFGCAKLQRSGRPLSRSGQPKIPPVSSKRWRDPLSEISSGAIGLGCSGEPHAQLPPSLPIGGFSAREFVCRAYLLASIWAWQTACVSIDTPWVLTPGLGGRDSVGPPG